MPEDTEQVLDALRAATRGTPYDGKLFLVGGFVRDKVMRLPSPGDDIDIVLEGDALALAGFLHEKQVARFKPVVYSKFGTAMIVVSGHNVEVVTARVESYAPDSRKPDVVQPGTLADDARRRDFTINTLLENLHTGDVTDPLGRAFADLEARLIRTPTDPKVTFADDPLRMLRAVRFAARFGFTIETATWDAVQKNAARLSIISAERIRDEFCKILLTTRPALGLKLLLDSGLLAQLAPELVEMVGVAQNEFHAFPVWDHTLAALENLPADASLALRLATLLHDVGKPRTKAVGDDGRVHFYHHQDVGAEMTRAFLHRLKFSNDDTAAVVALVAQHMRIGEYKPLWSDAAVRRLIRDLGPRLDDLFTLHRADVAALAPAHTGVSRAPELRARMDDIQAHQNINALRSPLTGQEIMARLNLTPGRRVGEIKDALTDAVIEGRLAPDDKESAARLARELYDQPSD